MMARLAGRRLREATAFWDASALVPVCFKESASGQAQSYFRKFGQVVWWASAVEIYSAICRLYREGKMADLDKDRAVSRLRSLRDGWREILPDEAIRNLACSLLEKPLKTSDSLQLAASLVWCNQRPSRRTFICGDRRLSSAAASAGFTVIQMS